MSVMSILRFVAVSSFNQRLKKNKQYLRENMGRIFSRAICLLIIVSLLSTSTFAAAPQMVTGAISETIQNTRFAFFRQTEGKGLLGWLSSSSAITNSYKQQQRNSISRIEISPGDVTIANGEKVIFAALAFDINGNTVSGVPFTWKSSGGIVNEGESQDLIDGVFEGYPPGVYKVSAETEGQKAEITVYVNDKKVLAGRLSSENTMIRVVSSREDRSTIVKDERAITKKGEQDRAAKVEGELQNPSNPTQLLPEEPGDGGWNNGNSGSIDDPGNQTGNPPGVPLDEGAISNNFQLSAPVLSLPGRGSGVSLNLNYNARLWNKSGTQLTYDIDKGFPAPGWSLGFGKMVYAGSSAGCIMIDAEGTRHSYTGNISNDDNGTQPNILVTFQGFTTDGTLTDYNCNMTIPRSGGSLTNSGVTAKLANGTVINYGAASLTGYEMFPTAITDVNGNFITITYQNNQGPNIATVTDTLGRPIRFQYDSANRLISVTAPGLGGGTDRTLARLHYKQIHIDKNALFRSDVAMTTVVREPDPYVLDAIFYPGTSTGYWFGDSDSYSAYGMIAKVVERAGMSWSGTAGTQGTVTPGSTITKQDIYNYPLAGDANQTDSPGYTTQTATWAGMDDAAAVTTYSVNNNDLIDGIAARSIIVTQPVTATNPNAQKNKQYTYKITNTSDPTYWKNGLVFQDQTFASNGSGGDTLVGSSKVDWIQGQLHTPVPERTLMTDEAGVQLKIEYGYTSGQYNQPTSICQYKFVSGQPQQLQCEVTEYVNDVNYVGSRFTNPPLESVHNGKHILNLVKNKEIKDENNVRVSRAEYEFDNNFMPSQNNPNLANTPGVVQHSLSYTPSETGSYEHCQPCRPNDPGCYYPNPNCAQTYPGQNCIYYNYQISQQCFRYPYYDAQTSFRGNVTKIKTFSDALNLTGELDETRTYDITGNLLTSSGSSGEQTSYLYDDPNTTQIDTQYGYPISVTIGSSNLSSPHRVTTSASFDFNTGLQIGSIDANGRPAITMYDANTLRPAQSNAPSGSYTLYNYNDGAMTITTETHEYGGNLAEKVVRSLNGIGQVRKESVAGMSGSLENEIATEYDNLGRVKRQSHPYKINVETPQWTEQFYDALGRTIKVIEPDGSTSEAFYNESQRPDSATTQIGQTVRSRDPWQRERWTRYDEQNRLVEVVEPNPLEADPSKKGSVLFPGTIATKYTYDAVDNLIETEQGVQHRRFAYDSFGRLTRQKLAEQTATLNDAGNYVVGGGASAKWSESFQYDDRSNLSQRTDARGVKTHYEYLVGGVSDPLNRLSRIWYDTSGDHDASRPIYAAADVNFVYETANGKDKTRVTKITAGTSMEDYAYDGEGRLSDYTLTISSRPSKPMMTSYMYDTLDRVKQIQYPAQYGLANNPRKIVEQNYDMTSRLTTLKYNGGQQAGNIVYNSAGQTTSIDIGATGANLVTESYVYDQQTGLIVNQKAQRGSNVLLDLSYEYRRKLNGSYIAGRTGQLSEMVNNLDRNKDRSYEYDPLGRLAKVTGGINQTWTQAYSYDRYGNRTNITGGGVQALRASQQANNKKDILKRRNSELPNSNSETANPKSIPEESALSLIPPTAEQLIGNVNDLVKTKAGGPSDSSTKEFNVPSEQKSLTTNESASNSRTPTLLLPIPNRTPFDFDGDGKADVSGWDRGNAIWTIQKSVNGSTITDQLGASGNQIAPGDYDGDGKTDEAVWNTSTGIWTIKRSSNGTVYTQQWGSPGDAIVPADYDNDGKTDVAVWRPSTGVWYILKSSNGQLQAQQWGGQQFGDIPTVGDYDGDGKADITVWRPSSGDFYISQSSTGQFVQVHWGADGDIPVPANYDGDNKTDFAVWRPSTGVWYITRSSDGQLLTAQIGSDTAGDILVPADYDGDGKADIAAWRPSTGIWSIRQSTTSTVITKTLGTSDSIAVPSAYIRRSSAPTAQSKNIQLDGLGNISYDANTNRITNSGFIYDVMGNLVKALAPDGVTWLRYEYDAANRLQYIYNDTTNQALQKFSYGADNRRLILEELTLNSITFYAWDGSITRAEYTTTDLSNPNNGLLWTKSCVFLGDKLLSTATPNGSGGEAFEYNHPDRLGTRLVTNPQNGGYFEQSTLPFGNVLVSETSGTTNRTFTSYDRNNNTKLDYAVNRTYDSGQGRFTQVDPVGMRAFNPINPQTLNLYSYCANDPINHVDSDGLFFGALFRAIGHFFRAAFKWIAIALSVVIAVLTIVYAPILFSSSLKLILGVIAAVTNAASSVLNGLGFSKAAAIFGIISAAASFGTSILAARSTLNWKTLLSAISSGATLVSRTLAASGYRKLGQIFGLVANISGFIASGLKPKDPTDPTKGFKWDSSIFQIYKFARGTAEQVALIAGANRVAGILNSFGIIDDATDLYLARKRFISLDLFGPNDIYKLDFLNNTKRLLTGTEETNARFFITLRNIAIRYRDQYGRVNSIIGRVERGVALVR